MESIIEFLITRLDDRQQDAANEAMIGGTNSPLMISIYRLDRIVPNHRLICFKVFNGLFIVYEIIGRGAVTVK